MSVRRVQDALVAALGPDAHVEHRANHTGVGKLSFAVHVGGRALWVKVAADEDADWPLTTWSRVAQLLAERHAAPPLLDTLAVDGRTALVFPFIDVPVATRGTLHERFDEARSVLTGLHGDAALADLLGPPTTTADCLREVWLERFVADLDIIEGYVAKDLHAYLADEVEALGILIDELDGPVHAPSTATRGTRTSWSRRTGSGCSTGRTCRSATRWSTTRSSSTTPSAPTPTTGRTPRRTRSPGGR